MSEFLNNAIVKVQNAKYAFCRFITANDVGKNGSHQAGFYIPKCAAALLFETPGVKGLGILPGEVLRIPDKEGLKIPHMGWNSIKIKKGARLFKDIPEDSYVYFVHSYYLKAGREEDVTATTEYSALIHASVEHDNVFACQFHPEKSSEIGLEILKNFVEL